MRSRLTYSHTIRMELNRLSARQGQQHARAEPLHRKGVGGRGCHVGFRFGHQAVDGGGEPDGQVGILGDELLGLGDQVELLAADREHGVRPHGESAHALDLVDEQGAQLGIEIPGSRLELVEVPANLELDDRKPLLLGRGRGLHQLVDDAGEPALRRLRRPVEQDRAGEVAAGGSALPAIGFARLIERAVDLHFHDLDPGREQPLRLLVGLEYAAQVTGQALPGRQAQAYQVLELRQVGAQ